jgi:hypothetical protein
VVKDPNREVQDRITLVFHTLLAQKTLTKVVRHFRTLGLKIPRRDHWGDIHWKPADNAALSEMVHNPAYAGTYAWGRSRWVKSPRTGRAQQVKVPREQWRVCLHDHYPAYISWKDFESIEAMLQDNHAEYKRNRTRGVPREGTALLQGIAYCGECGHKLGVQYKNQALYLCHFFQSHDGHPCQRLPANVVDDQVVRWFFEVLSAAEIDLSARVLVEADRSRVQVLAARRQEVERFQYQARLAERQFQRCDPDNRLVAAELERRWEEALRACQEADARLRADEAQASCLAIPADLLEQLKNLGPLLPEVWQQQLLKTSQKKALLRTLLDKVVLHRVASDQVRVRVVWRGGQTTQADLRVPVGAYARLSDRKEIDATIVRLASAGKSDEQIAAELNAAGHRAPNGAALNAAGVQRYRLAHRVYRYPHKARPRRYPGFLTLIQIAEKLHVSYATLYRYIFEGKLNTTKDAGTKCYLFPDNPATLRQFRQLLNGEISQLTI